jgi:hypothetical protein
MQTAADNHRIIAGFQSGPLAPQGFVSTKHISPLLEIIVMRFVAIRLGNIGMFPLFQIIRK